jgi:RHS repeat-associated protein
LFNAYDGLTGELENFLRNKWESPAGYRQQWSSLSVSGTVLAVGSGVLEGGWEAIRGVWDGIRLALEMLQNPAKFVEELGEGADRLIEVARKTPDIMKKAMLLASDEAALFLMMRCALIWLASLPPMQTAGDTARMTTAAVMGIVIDIVLAIVLTVVAEGTGIIYLAARLKKYGEIILKAVTGFVESVFAIINGFMGYVAKYIPVAVRGLAAPMKKGAVELRIDGRRNARLVAGKTGDDASRQATTPTGKSAEPAARTCTDKCPVSMVTGEELLTLLLTEIENESGEKYQLDYTPNGLIRQETGFDGQRTGYAYDLNGHLLEKTEFGADGSQRLTAYQRDSAGRLLRKTLPDDKHVEYRYRYDAFGRRIEKTVDGQSSEFIWQGDQLIAESSDHHYQSYVYEPGTFRPLALLEGQGPQNATPFYYHNDHLGTPQELTSHQGEIVWAARYTGYGKLTKLAHGTGKKLTQPLRFQGQYHDLESGLHYNRHRYYNPDTGRYLTADPIKLAGGLNAYLYVPNPTGWVDPLGLTVAPSHCPEPVPGGSWKFNPDVDLDWRDSTGTAYQQMHKGLDEAFIRTGIPKKEFSTTKWGKDQYGKSFPTEWRVLAGKNKGAEVNIDNPHLVISTDGPVDPHIGYQTPGKRGGGGAIRGHILLGLLPVSRSRIGVSQ